MRILVLGNYFPPHHIGGQELSCLEMVEALRERGHVVTVLTSRHRDSKHHLLTEDDVARDLFLEMDHDTRWNTLYAFGPYIVRREIDRSIVRRAVRCFEPDVAFVWGMWNLPRALAFEIETLMPGRVLYRFGDYWPVLPSQLTEFWRAQSDGARRGFLKGLLRPIALAILSRDALPPLEFPQCYCISDAVKNKLVNEHDVRVEHARVIHNGLKASKLTSLTSMPRRTLSGEPVGILYVGRLAREKGVHILMEALQLLPDVGAESVSRVTIVGDGAEEYVSTLRAFAEATPAEIEVKFVGRLPEQELLAIYADHHIAVVPSLWEEPFGRVTLEAMASGCLVIASRIGASPELLKHGEDGLLFEAGDATDLAAKLRDVISEPNLYHPIAEAARQSALTFSLDRTLEQVEQILYETQPAAVSIR